ncbi:class I SAM-dependent methyltransferase [Oscillatoria sp. HE19RPO]|uniref:class I SAM-dependent methyltransferase n=1 Tax=Oscillatoria sp. HE19RPO TaxID=2954806 RepID=UPI0020C54A8B|nr:class I SAM-dependent methyltransferase [Oscillatoria sp. HE19RPO]
MNIFYLFITENNQEQKQLGKFIDELNISKKCQILDLGCGYGNNIQYLQNKNNNKITGIDINALIIDQNRKEGLDCLTVEEFEKQKEKYIEKYDVLLMCHVIEHLPSNELLDFMNYYLDCLKKGGHLIIATPLYYSGFYDDFDHVKPYHPTGIDLVFGRRSAQVQYVARHQLELVDIWFRKSQHKLQFFPGLYLKNKPKWPHLINLTLAILFKASFGVIGRKTGWMGLYRKVSE